MKNKEQLAEAYAGGKSLSSVFQEAHIKDFLAGFNLAEELFKSKWISVGEQTPPNNIELLVKAPNGTIHLTSWRSSYDIFTCQEKTESSYDWKWMEIPQ